MGKLYLFCIGGTGHRVLKSLIMLLAGGMKIETNEIIPVIFDPDSNNGDLNRTKKLIEIYNKIRKELNYGSDEKFTKQDTSLFFNKIRGINFLNDFIFNLDGTTNQRYSSFIGYDDNNLDENSKALLSLLYSSKNLNLLMDEGFKGYPNIGAVVLNQFKNTQAFRDLVSEFNQDDKIFIVSSIFGGTGAAGFPLLLKNIRNADQITNNAGEILGNVNILKNAIIGALTVMPYFGVRENRESEISKRSFIPKTKAALEYYQRNINNSLNALYYIADKDTKDLENHSGKIAQMNFAHFIEIAGALAIKDFCSDDFNNGKKFKEFGIRDDTKNIYFSHLGEKTHKAIYEPILKLSYLFIYIEKFLKKNIDKQPWSKRKILKSERSNKLGKDFFNSDYFKKIIEFEKEYSDWLIELASNERKFIPFSFLNNAENISSETEERTKWKNIFTEYNFKSDLFDIVNGQNASEGKFYDNIRFIKNDTLFNDALNKFERKFHNFTAAQKFVGIFDKATTEIINKKITI